jgi:hypothetical protein
MIGAVEDGGTAGVDGVLTPEEVAEAVVQGLPRSASSSCRTPRSPPTGRKTADYDRWIGGMRKLRRKFGNPTI